MGAYNFELQTRTVDIFRRVSPPLPNRYVPLPKSAHASRVKSNADVFGFELSSEQMVMLDGMDLGGDGAVTWNPVDAA